MKKTVHNLVEKAKGFEWDHANINKLLNRHKVSTSEAEQVFFNNIYFSFYDQHHSQTEDRFAIYGETNSGRRLCQIFTIRNKHIRILSSRGFHQKELQKLKKTK